MQRLMSSSQLASLYDTHAPALFRFLMALTGHEADTRDLLQELFLRVARRPAAEVWRDPGAWLFRSARNLHGDFSRRRGARERALTRMACEAGDAEADPPEVEESRSPNAAAALAALPVDQRVVVHLKIWENLTFARIAEVLDIPANTAASRYRYALEKLRALLPQPCHSDES